MERNNDNTKGAARLRAYQGGSLKNPSTLSLDSIDLTSGPSSTRSSSASDDDILDPFASHNSLDVTNKNFDFSFVGDPRRDESNLSLAPVSTTLVHTN